MGHAIQCCPGAFKLGAYMHAWFHPHPGAVAKRPSCTVFTRLCLTCLALLNPSSPSRLSCCCFTWAACMVVPAPFDALGPRCLGR